MVTGMEWSKQLGLSQRIVADPVFSIFVGCDEPRSYQTRGEQTPLRRSSFDAASKTKSDKSA